jgi:hypothetical protein
LAKIQAIKSNVDLPDDERLEAGRAAAQEAQERHAELSAELVRQTDQRAAALGKTLYAGSDTAMLHALADLPPDALSLRAQVAYTAGDAAMLRAIRAVASAKGFAAVEEKATGLDPDPAVSVAYLERQRLQTSGVLEALSGAYRPPPITAQQLKPSSADVARARYAKGSQERSSTRILENRAGITDRT